MSENKSNNNVNKSNEIKRDKKGFTLPLTSSKPPMPTVKPPKK